MFFKGLFLVLDIVLIFLEILILIIFVFCDELIKLLHFWLKLNKDFANKAENFVISFWILPLIIIELGNEDIFFEDHQRRKRVLLWEISFLPQYVSINWFLVKLFGMLNKFVHQRRNFILSFLQQFCFLYNYLNQF